MDARKHDTIVCHITTKTVNALCEQLIRRSGCTPSHSDQRLGCFLTRQNSQVKSGICTGILKHI